MPSSRNSAAPPWTWEQSPIASDETFSKLLNSSLESAPKKPRHTCLAGIVFVLLTLIAAATGYAVYGRLGAIEDEQIGATLTTIAESRSAAVEAWLQERLADATAFSNGKLLGETMNAWIAQKGTNVQIERQVRAQLKAIKNTYQYREVAITDRKGNIGIASEVSTRPLDAIARNAVMRANAAGVPQFSGIHFSSNPAWRGHIVDIATPLPNLDQVGVPLSILYLRADADKSLGPFVQSFPLLSASSAVLLAEIRNGKIIATLTDQNASGFAYLDVIPVQPSILFNASHGAPDHLPLVNARGDNFLWAAKKIDGVPWYLISMVDQNAVRANRHRLAWTVLAACSSALSLFAFALLSWWKRQQSEFRFQTLRALTEKQLLQRQYDYLSRYANDMIVLTDADERVVEANDKAVQLLGQGAPALLGAQVSDLFSLSGKQALRENLRKLKDAGVALFELAQVHPDGTVLTIEVSARAIQLDERRFIQLICRDISERKQAEAALRESRERLNGILASIRDVVLSFSPDLSRLNFINRSAEAVYGHPVSAFLENPRLWFSAIHPDERNGVEQALRMLDPDHPSCDLEYRIFSVAGKRAGCSARHSWSWTTSAVRCASMPS
jgi:PAS domain S-box-containing protein